MRRDIFTSEHEAFRDLVRSFIAREITPYHEQWERDGAVSRDVWLAAGRTGLLGIDVDEKYGGGGNPDYTYYLIMNEELARAGTTAHAGRRRQGLAAATGAGVRASRARCSRGLIPRMRLNAALSANELP